ncbi:MAG: acyltransferase [Rhizobiales bacterium]|nr:acyltransferase [Hyphomicrobiales bacterium]
MSRPLEYRPYVDGLRAVAVLAVVLFHVFPGTFRSGFVGVDIFFVISGFLISGIIFSGLDKGSFGFADFYARRIRRIFPALILVLLFCWIVGWRVLLLDGFSNLGKHIAATAAFVPNLVFWQETGYFDTEATSKPLLHLWSLGVEEQYYVIWPLIAYFLWRRTSFALLAVAILLVASFGLNVAATRANPSDAFYLPFTRFWELMTGSLLGYIQVRHPHRIESLASRQLFRGVGGRPFTVGDAAAIAGLLLIIYATFLIRSRAAFPGFWALLPTAGAALMIAAGQNAAINRDFLSSRAMIFIGLISYPLYLWHWPLLAFIRIHEGDEIRILSVAAVAVSFLLAWLTYAFVEKPIRYGSIPNVRRYAPAVLVVVMFGVGVLGFVTYKRNGFPERLPPAIVQMLQHPFNYENSYRYKSCFLELGTQNAASYSPACVDPDTGGGGKPLVLLWGDSHAAHFYVGARKLQQETDAFRLAQFTGCSALDYGGKGTKGHCAKINEELRKRIASLRPDTVIIGGRWSRMGAELPQRLKDTVDFLRANGTKKIILVGPPPTWKPDLKEAVAYFYFRHGTVPERMTEGLLAFEDVRRTDLQLAQLSKQFEIEYVSTLNVFCNVSGCLTRIGNAAGSLVAIDSDHLSDSGSEYLFKAIRPLLSVSR